MTAIGLMQHKAVKHTMVGCECSMEPKHWQKQLQALLLSRPLNNREFKQPSCLINQLYFSFNAFSHYYSLFNNVSHLCQSLSGLQIIVLSHEFDFFILDDWYLITDRNFSFLTQNNMLSRALSFCFTCWLSHRHIIIVLHMYCHFWEIRYFQSHSQTPLCFKENNGFSFFLLYCWPTTCQPFIHDNYIVLLFLHKKNSVHSSLLFIILRFKF